MKNSDLLAKVYRDAVGEVTHGKGADRHGGDDLLTQPWAWISSNYGEGFLLGQTAKKMHEARMMADPNAWDREMLGALNYLAFAILSRRLKRQANRGSEVPMTGGDWA